jgi:hypothetical protein
VTMAPPLSGIDRQSRLRAPPQYAFPLKHGKTPHRGLHKPAKQAPALRGMGMTVCTASMFYWMYGDNDIGPAIVTASDRMLTDIGLGIEYQGSRYKGATVTKKHMVLVSGDVTVHSAMILEIAPIVQDNSLLSTLDIAELCSKFMRTHRMKDAARTYLAPLNLDEESFIDRQRTMEPQLVIELTNQLQGHKIEVEALVIGCDDKLAHMYRVDQAGIVSCHDDIGFVSIGNGGVHSSAQFMLDSYVHNYNYCRALYLTFSAKKRAEVAPGVGDFTDMFFINRNGVTQVPLTVINVLNRIYKENQKRIKKFPEQAETRIIAAEKAIFPQPSEPAPEPQTDFDISPKVSSVG